MAWLNLLVNILGFYHYLNSAIKKQSFFKINLYKILDVGFEELLNWCS